MTTREEYLEQKHDELVDLCIDLDKKYKGSLELVKAAEAKAKEEIEQAKAIVKTYIDELERCAIGTKALLGHLDDRQKEGDRLRTRLIKLMRVFHIATNLLNLYRSKQDATEAEVEYAKELLLLETPDDAPSDGQPGPGRPVPNSHQ